MNIKDLLELPLSDAATEDIAGRNKLFANASTKEKRMLIAKDVIAHIQSKFYYPDHTFGVFILNGTGYFEYTVQNMGLDLDVYDTRTFMLNNKSNLQCGVCALGGLLTTCILFNNNTSIHRLVNFEREIGIS